MNSPNFKIVKNSQRSRARVGVITAAHGKIRTPVFLPDATRGVIKLTGSGDLLALRAGPLVANTYHLLLQPGIDIVKKLGGLNRLLGWPLPLMSDSGGYQVYSLIRRARVGAPGGKITDNGVTFKSPLDGGVHELTPEKVIRLQLDLGVDMMVALDDCPPNDSSRAEIERAVERTIAWAERSKKEYDRIVKRRLSGRAARPLILAVIQGGPFADLRKRCADALIKIGFDGYGFGARPVDRDGKFLGEILAYTAEMIPPEAMRFALGVGLPEDIVRCAAMGWDMFDCVIPTREGRHGRLFLWDKKRISNFQFPISNKNLKFYTTINITNSKFKTDRSPINPDSKLPELRRHSKAFLNHLYKIREPLGARLASLNNLEFYYQLVGDIGRAVRSGRL